MRYIRRIIVILFAAAVAVYLVTTICVTRKKDTTPPVIICDEDEIEVASDASEEELLSGLTATDNKDGDITDRIRIGSHSKFIKPGVCEVSYLVFDSSYNVGQYTRRVVYTDYISPEFSLTDSLVYDVNAGVTMLDRIHATDVIDGDISEKIKIVSSNVNEGKEGTYTVCMEVTNDYADVVSLELPVHIIEGVDKAPSVQLKTYLVYAKVGNDFKADQYLKKVVNAEGNSLDTDSVKINSSVDTAQAGTYEVSYSCTDEEGMTGVSYLVVVVTD